MVNTTSIQAYHKSTVSVLEQRIVDLEKDSHDPDKGVSEESFQKFKDDTFGYLKNLEDRILNLETRLLAPLTQVNKGKQSNDLPAEPPFKEDDPA